MYGFLRVYTQTSRKENMALKTRAQSEGYILLAVQLTRNARHLMGHLYRRRICRRVIIEEDGCRKEDEDGCR